MNSNSQKPDDFGSSFNTGNRLRKDWANIADSQFSKMVNHRTMGFGVRFGILMAGLTAIGGVAKAGWENVMADKPLAQRWNSLLPYTEITLVEKDEDITVGVTRFRFKLPEPHDYTGHRPVSSVQIHHGAHSRWYTPINHPEERGYIEFAIRTGGQQGMMRQMLRGLKVGQSVQLGRWMKEWEYVPNANPELGMVMSKSGISVALQILKYSASLRGIDKTNFKILHCCTFPHDIPMSNELDTLQRQLGDRMAYTPMVLGMNKEWDASKQPLVGGTRTKRIGDEKHKQYTGLIGQVTPETLKATMPERFKQVTVTDKETGETRTELKKNHIVVCGNWHMMSPVCGGSVNVKNFTYVQGFFGGFLKDMGWTSDQVTRFGITWSLLNQQSAIGWL